MSCLDKCHMSQGGGMQGHYKYTDGFSDTSSVGSFMDETDREVSSLTDRAFRSLCIGDEAVYNDSEFTSSPVEHNQAFSLDSQKTDILKFTDREALSLDMKWDRKGVENEAGIGATFQQSVLDLAKRGRKNDHGLHPSNGAIEMTWQQSKNMLNSTDSAPRVDGHQKGQEKPVKDFKYKNSSSESWEKSVLVNIQGELSDTLPGGLKSLKGGNFNPIKNHFHSSRDKASQIINKDLETPPAAKSSKGKRKSSKPRKLSSKNFFLHSEHSPFESWRDCNKFLSDQNHTAVPADDRPKWYDSPLYKQLTAAHGFGISESKDSQPNQNKTKDAPTPPAPPTTLPAVPPSSVVQQKALAVERRSESESGVSYPPWRKKRNLERGALLGSRPCTVAPCGGKEGRRSEEELAPIAEVTKPASSGGVVAEIPPATAITMVTTVPTITTTTVVNEPVSNSSTPFSISQLLTPIIHARQGTGSSEVLQSALSPSSLDLDLSPSAFTDAALRPFNEVKLRNNYKAIASSLLFNLKDNRKRVKSTYSPPKFKTADLGKQPPKPETDAPKNAPAISEVSVAEASASLQPKANNVRPVSEIALEPTTGQTIDHKKHADGGISDDYLTLSSPHTVKEAPGYRGFNSVQENALGKVQHDGSDNSQYSGSEQSKSSRNPLHERQGYPTLNLYKARSTTEAETETTTPVVEVPVCAVAVHEKDRGGVKEMYSLKEKDLTKRADLLSQEAMSRKNASLQSDQGIGEQHSDRKEACVSKQNEKSHVKTEILSVKNEDKVVSTETVVSENSFAAQTNHSIKQDALATLDKYQITEKSLATTERQNDIQRPGAMKEKELARKEGRTKHVFAARQNQYIKNERYAMRDNDDGGQAEEDIDALVRSEDRHAINEVQANTAHQKGKPGIFTAREMSVAGDMSTLMVHHEGSLSNRESKDVGDNFFGQSYAQEKVLEGVGATSRDRIPSTEEIFTGKGEDIGRALCTTKGNTLTSSDALDSRERQWSTENSHLIKESTDENEASVRKENQWAKKEASEEGCETKNEKMSLTRKKRETTEKEIDFMKEKDAVKECSPTEKEKYPTKNDMLPVEEDDYPKDSSGTIEESQPSENNMIANKDRSINRQEFPQENRRDHRKYDVFAEKEKESSKVRDIESKEREQAKQEDVKEVEKSSVGVNKAKQKDIDKRTSVKEKTDFKGNGKFDSGMPTKEKESKMKQILKLKDKVKDVLSIREHKTKEEVTERQDKHQAKPEISQRHENDHKQLLPNPHKEKDKVKHEGFERTQKDSAENETAFSKETQNNRKTVEENAKETIREQMGIERRKRRPAPPVPLKVNVKTEGQPALASIPEKSLTQPHLSIKETQHETLEQEVKGHSASGIASSKGDENKDIRHMITPMTEDLDETPPLQNYNTYNGESEMDAKGRLVSSPLSDSLSCKSECPTSPSDFDEGGWVRCLIEYAKSQTPGPRSNTSSPSPSNIKPALFKVKDNTFRSSPLTKTVKAPSYRSLPEDFRLSSPRDSWSGSEKGEDERGRLKDRSEIRSPRDVSASRRDRHPRDTLIRSPMLSPLLRRPCQEEEERHSAVIAVSEDVVQRGERGRLRDRGEIRPPRDVSASRRDLRPTDTPVKSPTIHASALKDHKSHQQRKPFQKEEESHSAVTAVSDDMVKETSKKSQDERGRLKERGEIRESRDVSASWRDLRDTPLKSPTIHASALKDHKSHQQGKPFQKEEESHSPVTAVSDDMESDLTWSKKNENERGRLKDRGELRTPRDASASRRDRHPKGTSVSSSTILPVVLKEHKSPQLRKPFREEEESHSALTAVSVEVENHTLWSKRSEDERGRLKDRVEIHAPRNASASRRARHPRDMPGKSPTTQASTMMKEHQSHQGRKPCQEEEENHSAIIAEEADSRAASSADTPGERAASSLHTEEAEGSKEPSEKSESVCSAGETQPLGKPPPVLPKSEKALRRAKRLTNKRIKKVEADSKHEGKSRSSRKPVQEGHTEPLPPAKTQPSQHAHSPPKAPQLCPEPDHSQSSSDAVPQSLPMTQRKLLQDPDSGQYFMVDMPMQIKTKTFFDPETGKYVQLPVRSPEVVSSRPPSMEILNTSYLLYPGFVPVPVSSLPTQGSASQTPASESLSEDQEKMENSTPLRQEDF